MKYVGFSTLLIVGLCHAVIDSEDKSKSVVLKRVKRNAIPKPIRQVLQVAESFVISNCKKATNGTVGDDLQRTYDKMRICVGKKPIVITPRNEYNRHIEECTRKAINKTTNCLASDQKYFPKFILDLTKSIVSVVYDDFLVFVVSMPSCMKVLNRADVKRKCTQCVMDATVETQYTIRIPSSKASLCRILIPATQCFTDLLRDRCDSNNSGLKKFRAAFSAALKRQCEKKDPLPE